MPETPTGAGTAWAASGAAVWSLLTAVVLVAAGGLFIVSRTTARGTDLRTVGRPDLTRFIARTERRLDGELRAERRLRGEVAALTAAVGPRGPVAAAQRRADRLVGSAGLSQVRGPAVRVTLDDAPHDPGQSLPAGVSADDLVVHQQDVQAVVNALWAGGAEAMTIMDQRVIATSAVRCVGNTLLLQGQVYSPPFVVTAVGNPASMHTALTSDPAVRTYRDYADALGLGYSERALTATMPAYDGPLDLVAAQAIGAAS